MNFINYIHEDPLTSADISIITRDPLSLVHSTSNMLGEVLLGKLLLVNLSSHVGVFLLSSCGFPLPITSGRDVCGFVILAHILTILVNSCSTHMIGIGMDAQSI